MDITLRDPQGTGKTQAVRILDVIAFGPLMMYAATTRRIPQWARTSLFIIGIGTIIYNWKNYRTVERITKE